MKKTIIIIALLLLLAGTARAEFIGGKGQMGRHIITGTLTIDASSTGTAVVLSADNSVVRGLAIRALPNNSCNVYIGNAFTANDGMGFVLSGDTILTIPVIETNDVYMDSDKEGDGITWLGIVK